MRRATLACACVLAALAGCGPRGGSDVGNGATVTLDVGGYKQSASAAGAGITLESGATVSEFWLSVGRFRLQGGEECASEDDAKLIFGGPIVANLVQLDAAPGRSEPVAVNVGPHCRLRVELDAVSETNLPSGAPDDLRDAVLFVRGTRADGVSFSVRSTKVVDLRLDAVAPDGFELEEHGSTPMALVVAFDLEAAVMALDLDLLEESSIVIDEKTNMARLAAFENSLHKTASLFEDEDADGVLVDGESASGKELAGGVP